MKTSFENFDTSRLPAIARNLAVRELTPSSFRYLACPYGLRSFQKKNHENLSPKGMFLMFSFEQVMIRRIGGVDADFLEARLQESLQTQLQKDEVST